MEKLEQTYSKEWLIDQRNSEKEQDLLFFWGHTAKDPDTVGKECLSQWYPRSISVDEINYTTAEHWMMARKAELFGDQKALSEILRSDSPKSAKQAGRRVSNFDPTIWDQHKFRFVLADNLHKFQQHTDLAAFLITTGKAILVEASPHDAVWGIGLSATQAESLDPVTWKGENLLGFALMQVRDTLNSVFPTSE